MLTHNLLLHLLPNCKQSELYRHPARRITMADPHHKELATTIKSVHQTLRQVAKKLGEDKAWEEHCKQTQLLETYSQAMQQLATEYWEKNADDNQNTRAVSRVRWAAEQCESYYFEGGVVDAYKKEILLCNRFNVEVKDCPGNEVETFKSLERIRVLDVGSCYNPFKKFPRFNVVALDIAPASSDVLKCDFLNLNVVKEVTDCQNFDGQITELSASSFHVVIFSLLLEYFPSSKQRYICCQKASQLLFRGGILCIMTPDSKHATANSVIMKKWRYALANVGFLRTQYRKLPHLHCMVFRKCFHSPLPKQWLLSLMEIDKLKGKAILDPPEQLIVIPQDFQTPSEGSSNVAASDVRDDNETVASIFLNLPTL